ncbi:hypothetical protein JKP88DRAFT_266815 [Tribonema minus]|uniref:Glucose/Sorbosone dehydrogenase domain-containing protein n=1 Tax=Tribonema minus TaxID=303371 RepID=A0A835ZBG7_9STRA|nr:hypothetical protein JKP88DRAFT_266815 [Tribonema minus]
MLDIAGRSYASVVEHSLSLTTKARVRLLVAYGLAGELRAVHIMEEARDDERLSPSVVIAMKEDMMQGVGAADEIGVDEGRVVRTSMSLLALAGGVWQGRGRVRLHGADRGDFAASLSTGCRVDVAYEWGGGDTLRKRMAVAVDAAGSQGSPRNRIRTRDPNVERMVSWGTVDEHNNDLLQLDGIDGNSLMLMLPGGCYAVFPRSLEAAPKEVPAGDGGAGDTAAEGEVKVVGEGSPFQTEFGLFFDSAPSALLAAVYQQGQAALLRLSADVPSCADGTIPSTEKAAQLTFCSAPELVAGACCNAGEEQQFKAQLYDVYSHRQGLSAECEPYQRRLACGKCYPSGEDNLLPAGVGEPLLLSAAFCKAYAAACGEDLHLPTDYCSTHSFDAVEPDAELEDLPVDQPEPEVQDHPPALAISASRDLAAVNPVSYYSDANVNIPAMPIGAYQNPVTNAWWFAGHEGVISKAPNNPQAAPGDVKTVLDIKDRVTFNSGELGLNGLAFSPDYSVTKFFYVSYIHISNGNYQTYISRFTDKSDAASTKGTEKVILTFDTLGLYHKGGQILFEPADIANFANKSGFNMYIPTGDGAQVPPGATDGFNDKYNRGQTITSPLGKILRIFIKPDGTYYKPSGNLKDSNGNLQLAWAYGFRNPWKWRLLRQVYIGAAADVVWRCGREQQRGGMYVCDFTCTYMQYTLQVDKVEPNGNHGWRVYEGTRYTNLEPALADSANVKPAYEVCHSSDTSGTCQGKPFTSDCIIGGFVYRGTKQSYVGNYVFADFSGSRIARLYKDSVGKYQATTIVTWDKAKGLPVALAEALNGELYVVTAYPSAFYKLTDTSISTGGTCPAGGILSADKTVCCSSSCGTCGGTGCNTLYPACPGGGANCCCTSNIT